MPRVYRRGASSCPRPLSGSTVYAVRHGSFKGVLPYDIRVRQRSSRVAPAALALNLDHDPAERFDVAKQHPGIMAEIERIAAAAQGSGDAGAHTTAAADSDRYARSQHQPAVWRRGLSPSALFEMKPIDGRTFLKTVPGLAAVGTIRWQTATPDAPFCSGLSASRFADDRAVAGDRPDLRRADD